MSTQYRLAAVAAASVLCCLVQSSMCLAEAVRLPWLDEVQVPLLQSSNELTLPPTLAHADGSPIRELTEWQRRREEIRRWWLSFLGMPQRDQNLPVQTLRILSRKDLEDVSRCLIEYETQQGWKTKAYLLFPRGSDIFSQRERRLPAIVVFHSTTNDTIRQPAGLTSEKTKAFGLELARRGYVTLCPECFLWSGGPPYDYRRQVERFTNQFPGVKGMAKMLLDGQAAVDLLVSFPGVNPHRLGAVGHSLGGKEVLYLAAFDERIRASVSSEGGIALSFSNWDAPWYLGQEIRRTGFGHDHHELIALVAPRAFLLIGGDSAEGEKSIPFLQAAWPVYQLYGERPALGLWNHRRGHTVPEIAVHRIAEWFDVYLSSTMCEDYEGMLSIPRRFSECNCRANH